MQIKIYGIGCEKHRQLYLNTKNAIAELGIEADIQEIKSVEQIAEAGFHVTPGLAIDDEPLVTGRVVTVDELKILLCRYQRLLVC